MVHEWWEDELCQFVCLVKPLKYFIYESIILYHTCHAMQFISIVHGILATSFSFCQKRKKILKDALNYCRKSVVITSCSIRKGNETKEVFYGVKKIWKRKWQFFLWNWNVSGNLCFKVQILFFVLSFIIKFFNKISELANKFVKF